jgi:hypothetical protein
MRRERSWRWVSRSAVRESRLFMQVATRDRFVAAIESIVGRRVESFVSATDPDRDVVYEICEFAPVDGSG